jgi:hypothetical protein
MLCTFSYLGIDSALAWVDENYFFEAVTADSDSGSNERIHFCLEVETNFFTHFATV